MEIFFLLVIVYSFVDFSFDPNVLTMVRGNL